MEKGISHFKKYLLGKRLKLTRQREAIAEAFLDKKGHICVDDLYYLLRKRYPHIGYTTIYRTIRLLKDAEMASEVNFTGKRKRFEYALDRGHHDHFICVKCGKIIEFNDPAMDRDQDRLCEKYRFASERRQTQIFGKCSACRKGKN